MAMTEHVSRPTKQRAPAKRSPTLKRAGPTSQGDVYDLVEELKTSIETLGGKVDDVIALIGREGQDEYGKPIGTGLTGRLMRHERKLWAFSAKITRLIQWGAGGVAGLSLAGAVVWWLVEGKLERIFQ